MRPESGREGGDDDAGADGQRQAPLPVAGRQPGQREQQARRRAALGQPHRRQARRTPARRLASEANSRKPSAVAAGKRHGIGARAAALVASSTQNSTIADARRARDRSASRARSPATARWRCRASARRARASDRQSPATPGEQRQLPAVMIDPLGHEHAVGRAGEEQGEEGQRIGARVDQPPRGQRQRRTAAADTAAAARSRPPTARPRRRRGTAEAAGSARRSADRPAATSGCWRRTAGSADTGEDRTSPARASRPRTCIIRILSSVSPSANQRICAQLLEDEPGAERRARRGRRSTSSGARPARARRRSISSSLRLRHFSGCSRSTSKGKQPQAWQPD